MNNSELKGTVDKITYKNRENGYTVFKLKSGRDSVTCVGILPMLSEGDSVIVNGEYANHPVYGEQFNVSSVEISAPKTQLQILKFLSSGAIKGVGPATAVKIVEKFKAKALEIIENYPMELTAIRGISAEKAKAICEEYKKQFGIRDIMLSLAEFNITPTEAAKVFKILGIHSIERIRENPFVLCMEGIEFGFERVEEIYESLGLPSEGDDRVCAGIEYVLRKNLSNGHTCLPLSKLLTVSERLLGVSEIMIMNSIKNMADAMRIVGKIYNGEEFVFLYEYFAAEEFIASKLTAYMRSNVPLYGVTEQEISVIENKLGYEFDPKQTESVNAALENNVFVLTGGPGTGKTTTLNALIHILSGRQLSIVLAAPTGRAAKRITELTGFEAKTLHRLLEVEWSDGAKQVFSKNRKNPLDEDVIIIDEMSMVDTMLFRALLEATRITSRIIIVGDSDQLPSVGAGNVLGDLIASGKVASVKLDKIFRQSDASDIVKNAHSVILGIHPTVNNSSSDFFFVNEINPERCARTVIELVSERLPNAYGFSPVDDIQVLCPSKKMTCGSHNLNLLIQEALNPTQKDTKQLIYKGISFKLGDKVMQTKNNYDIVWTSETGESGSGIFNGDIGVITDIDVKNKTISVRYDDKIASYFEDELDIIELAYAATVHKSQGSEFDCVIIPLCDTPKPLRYRNLIYTAITRAKKLLILVGNRDVLYEMIENDRKTLRYSGLSYLMCDYED